MPESDDKANGPLVVGLGEALFDCFEDDRKLGGAPLNVAFHADALLRQHGGSAFPVTRVGNDSLGDEAIQTLSERGVSTAWIQRDDTNPTGRVSIELDSDGIATYEFESNSAWDHLEFTDGLAQVAAQCRAVAFGSLAQRSQPSRETIQKFLAHAEGAVRLFDVNLRQGFYTDDILKDSLERATVAKANEEELGVLAEHLLPTEYHAQTLPKAAEHLRSSFTLEWVAVTRGPRGVAIATADGWHEGDSPVGESKQHIKSDTVGAGDACCAGLLAGMLVGLPVTETLELSNAAGSFVASQPGATPELPRSVLDMLSR